MCDALWRAYVKVIMPPPPEITLLYPPEPTLTNYLESTVLMDCIREPSMVEVINVPHAPVKIYFYLRKCMASYTNIFLIGFRYPKRMRTALYW